MNLIMEYMPNLCLNDFMKCKKEKRLEENESKIISK